MAEIIITPSEHTYTADTFDIRISDPNSLMWLHAYMDYLMEREIKRTYRGNHIPDPDYKRICICVGQKDTPGNREKINEADRMAYAIGWIKYDKEGSYGYSSEERLYRNNIIYLDKKVYQQYLAIKSDDHRYNTLVKCFYSGYTPKHNELFDQDYYGAGVLNKFHFDRYGYGREVLENIQFDQVRLTLITYLSKFTPGKWYTTQSFIEAIEKQEPYFFIPKNHKVSRYNPDKSRYADFYESSISGDYQKRAIDEKDLDAFQRVEGRFVERFLESLPYTLGWVELAYTKKCPDDVLPSYGHLQAFKITPILDMLYKQSVPAPRVTLLPNYEMTVEGLYYPVTLMHQLAQLGDINHQGTVSQVTLNKDKIIKLSAAQPELDIVLMLKKITHQSLPHNVETDLSEWCQQGEAFTLYNEVVLFESPYSHDCLKEHLVKNIAKGVFMVSDDQKLAAKLDKAQDVSLIINHSNDAFTLLPKSYNTRLPKVGVKQVKKKQPKRKIKLKKQTHVSYDFLDKEAFQLIKETLIAKKIVIGVNESNRTISFSKQYETDFKQALKTAHDRYQFIIEEE